MRKTIVSPRPLLPLLLAVVFAGGVSASFALGSSPAAPASTGPPQVVGSDRRADAQGDARDSGPDIDYLRGTRYSDDTFKVELATVEGALQPGSQLSLYLNV